MNQITPKALLFAGRIAPTTKHGARKVVVNTLRPCWTPAHQQRIACAVEGLLRRNFRAWMLEAPGFDGPDGTANFRVYWTPQGVDVVVFAPSGGRLFDGAGRVSACARVGWWIRHKLRDVNISVPETPLQLDMAERSC